MITVSPACDDDHSYALYIHLASFWCLKSGYEKKKLVGLVSDSGIY